MTSRLLFIAMCFIGACTRQVAERVDVPAMGYGKPGLFIYQVTHTLPGASVLNIDTLALFCSDIAMKDLPEQNISQWKTLTKDVTGKYTFAARNAGNSISGITANDSVLFIHPPRYGRYRLLEFCPFPLYYPYRHQWTWDLEIGKVWAVDSVYRMDSTGLFHIVYDNDSIEHIAALQGNLPCRKITAISTSRFGTSSADFYFNYNLGLVYWHTVAVDGQGFEFKLLEKTGKVDSGSFYSDVVNLYNRYKDRRSQTFQHF